MQGSSSPAGMPRGARPGGCPALARREAAQCHACLSAIERYLVAAGRHLPLPLLRARPRLPPRRLLLLAASPVTMLLLREGPAGSAAAAAPAAGLGCCWAGARASGLRLREGAPPRSKLRSTAADTLPAGPDHKGVQMPPSKTYANLPSLIALHHLHTSYLACRRRQSQTAVQAAGLPWTAVASPTCHCPNMQPNTRLLLNSSAVHHRKRAHFGLPALCSRRSSLQRCCGAHIERLEGLPGTRQHCY